MLKLVFPRRPSRRPRKRDTTLDAARMLNREVARGYEAGASTQRTIAAGRRTIIEGHGTLQPASSRTLKDDVPPGAEVHVHPTPELAARLDAIHQRLLVLSTSVEFEIDRLAIVATDIEQLIARTAAGEKLS